MSEDCVDVDVSGGTVEVDMGDAEIDKDALAAALEATNKYSLDE